MYDLAARESLENYWRSKWILMGKTGSISGKVLLGKKRMIKFCLA